MFVMWPKLVSRHIFLLLVETWPLMEYLKDILRSTSLLQKYHRTIGCKN